MHARSLLAAAMLEAGSSGSLLTLVQVSFNGDNEDAATARTILEIAGQEPAFAESLADALCLYFQREASNLEAAGPEFEQMLALASAIKRLRVVSDLMTWVDRHCGDANPSDKDEERFALALWTLLAIQPPDSSTFVRWWMERVEKHRESWLARHFVEDAVPKLPPSSPRC